MEAGAADAAAGGARLALVSAVAVVALGDSLSRADRRVTVVGREGEVVAEAAATFSRAGAGATLRAGARVGTTMPRVTCDEASGKPLRAMGAEAAGAAEEGAAAARGCTGFGDGTADGLLSQRLSSSSTS
jgi:hypothetical protein